MIQNQNKTEYNWSEFQSVRELATAPCCQHNDWCSYRDEANFGIREVYCRRKTEGAIRIASDGSGVYRFPIDGSVIVEQPKKPNITASLNRRDAVYKQMLKRLPLVDRDYTELTSRGLTEEEIHLLGYKTAEDIAELLAGNGWELARVPGFYREQGWKARVFDGFFIPVLSQNAKIEAMQIRRCGKPKNKYVWFSSFSRSEYDAETKKKKKIYLEMGATSGAPVHHRINGNKECWITEGFLKSDILWLRRPDIDILATAGVRSHDQLVRSVLGGRYDRVVIAYDMDWKKNQDVLNALNALGLEILRRTGKEPQIAGWNNVKGVDEALIRGEKIHFMALTDWRKRYGGESSGIYSGYRTTSGVYRRAEISRW